MKYCQKCGSPNDDSVKFCTRCGSSFQQNNTSDFANQVKNEFLNTKDDTNQFDFQDINENKYLCIFSYLSILFFIPLIAKPNSKYCRFHSSQGLNLFLISVVASILNFIPFFGRFLYSLIGLFVFVLSIIGIVNTCIGKAKELPIIGNIKLINY